MSSRVYHSLICAGLCGLLVSIISSDTHTQMVAALVAGLFYFFSSRYE